MTADLLAVLGQPSGRVAGAGGGPRLRPRTAQLLGLIGDAFTALRRRAGRLLALQQASMALGLPGASVPRDFACLRSRLLLHLPDDEAEEELTKRMFSFLHLDAA